MPRSNVQSLEVHVPVLWRKEEARPNDDESPLCRVSSTGNTQATGKEAIQSAWLPPSSWSTSAAKRGFDLAAVILTFPLTLPILLLVGLAVRFSSRGPVLFVQARVGRDGKLFNILKFRTMAHNPGETRPTITTLGNQPFTPVGRFLRRWKLDELPQLANVLRGDMSLVGPRPKVPDHEYLVPMCRPGITGAATLAFAREEAILNEVPCHSLDHYVHWVVLPAKRWIDAEYTSAATFRSDLVIILKTLFRRWDCSAPAHGRPFAGANSYVAYPESRTRRESNGVPAEALPAED